MQIDVTPIPQVMARQKAFQDLGKRRCHQRGPAGNGANKPYFAKVGCKPAGHYVGRIGAGRARFVSAEAATVAEAGRRRAQVWQGSRPVRTPGGEATPEEPVIGEPAQDGHEPVSTCDGHGTPLEVVTTASNVNDHTQFLTLVVVPPAVGRPGVLADAAKLCPATSAATSRSHRGDLCDRRTILPVISPQRASEPPGQGKAPLHRRADHHDRRTARIRGAG